MHSNVKCVKEHKCSVSHPAGTRRRRERKRMERRRRKDKSSAKAASTGGTRIREAVQPHVGALHKG